MKLNKYQKFLAHQEKEKTLPQKKEEMLFVETNSIIEESWGETPFFEEESEDIFEELEILEEIDSQEI